MKKIYLFLLFFIFFFAFSTSKIFAVGNFSTEYNVTYTINQNATTNVNIDVSLINETSQYYASSYKIQVGFKDVSSLKASDSNGSINPTTTDNTKGSAIEVSFNKRVVGKGNRINFNISFNTKEVAQNQGNIWEINIPGLSSQNDFSSFNASVIYPQSFGSPVYIKPYIDRIQNSGNKLTFSKEELGTSGISIAFGNAQTYSFKLLYHLKNSNLIPVKTEIALPPNTNYQEVLIDSLSPKPLNVRVDKEGNWLAEYRLSPSQKLNISAIGKVKIYLNPKKEILDPKLFEEYLEDRPYWQVSDPEIKKLADKLKTPSAIYQYIVENLNYDYSRVTSDKPRIGAIGVLSDPTSAVCLEFTDLFVAIARAAGIPAREINGFAYTKNTKERPLSLVQDILHAWPEYYDSEKQSWIMVDPTWGNTTGGVDYFKTLDFDHFAFVLKGLNSSYPVPAGGYKYSEDKYTKDVDITFTPDFTNTNTSSSVKINFPKTTISKLPIKGTVKIENTGKNSIPAQSILVETDNLLPKKQEIEIGQIPPFGYTDVKVNFDATAFLTNIKDTVKITFENKTYYKGITVSPFFLNLWVLLGGLIFVIIILGILFIAARARRLPIFRRKKQDNLHWESEQS